MQITLLTKEFGQSDQQVYATDMFPQEGVYKRVIF